MRSRVIRFGPQLFLSAVIMATFLVPAGMTAQFSPLDSDKVLQPHNVTMDRVSYRGRNAVRVMTLPNADAAYDQKSGTGGGGIVLLEGTSFHDGTIEVDVAGMPRANAPASARGFVGIASRVPPTLPNMTTSTYAPPTGAPTIRNRETTPPNTFRFLTTNG